MLTVDLRRTDGEPARPSNDADVVGSRCPLESIALQSDPASDGPERLLVELELRGAASDVQPDRHATWTEQPQRPRTTADPNGHGSRRLGQQHLDVARPTTDRRPAQPEPPKIGLDVHRATGWTAPTEPTG